MAKKATSAAPAAAAPAKKAAPAKAPAKGAAAPAAPAKAAAPATVTQKHIAATLGEKHDMPRKEAEALVGEMFGLLVDHLKSGDRVRVAGLGIIEVKDRPARMGRNPATGEQIQIAASRKIAFRAAKELKEAI